MPYLYSKEFLISLCLLGIMAGKEARCFEVKVDAVQKIKYKCLWFLAFWCNVQDVKDENSLVDLIVTTRTRNI